ncbi:MAG TPA: NAD(P)H-dependent oxidoreductase [Rhodocyclaceae bacterium]|nr:NAD(P)H-dependent oxidoreductase [Rhodocyclaceae bacterium]
MKILVFAGSARSASLNKRLAAEAYRLLGEAGVEATLIDLRDYDMPIYDGDLEAASGSPENARKLRTLFSQHEGLLIVTPENNSSLPSLLKNTIDWISRSEGGVSGGVYFKGKIAAIMAASPGGLGGLRVLFHLRQVLNGLGMLVIPEQFALAQADKAFDKDGRLQDVRHVDAVRAVVARLSEVCRRMSA